MNLESLIERGYFLKELPPPFNSKLLAQNIVAISADWATIFENNTARNSPAFVLNQLPNETPGDFIKRKKAHSYAFIARYKSSKAVVFSISKGKLSRRLLQIPNPNHYRYLSEKIVDIWPDFQAVFALSEYSKSYPVTESNALKRSVSTVSKNVAEFHNDLLHASFNKTIQVKIDISKFNPTIYTHSIPWALLGKEKAKFYFEQRDTLGALIDSGDLDAARYKKADEIDTAVRSCQERQSIGIPIGPDTSHILAEALACRIDTLVKERFMEIDPKVCRFYDDYYFYVSSMDDADRVLNGLQLILNGFQLEINENKVSIKEYPFAFEEAFTAKLFLFKFTDTNLSTSLRHYFSLVWDVASKDPKKTDWIFRYSLKTFEYLTTRIPSTSWPVFQDLLLKTALLEPSVLDVVTRILLTYRAFLNPNSLEQLKEIINAILNEHCILNHNFEVSWALWLAKTFEIQIEENCANLIIQTGDSIAILILLDLIRNTTLVTGHPNVAAIEAQLKDDILYSEKWLLAYEGIKKGWLAPANPNLLRDDHFFALLADRDVEFYNGEYQLHANSLTTKPAPPVVTTPDQYDSMNANIYEAMMMEMIYSSSNFN